MTPARQQRKSARLMPAAWGAVWRLAVALVAALPVVPVSAGMTERIVVDPQSGLAMNGLDPVSYFTDATPQFGRPDQEARHAGVIWRFRNEGNRAAFVEHPEIYAPQFGGYDPVAIARGVPVPGHPLIWIISDQRLYFFYDNKARAEFVESPPSAIIGALQRWPQV